ncbi:MAG: hypothetical protein RLN99_17240, partial [Kiloniellaceae bacterium]
MKGPSVVESVSPVPKRRRARRGPPGRGWQRVAAGGSSLLFLTAVGSLVVMEAKTSTLQARFFSEIAGEMTYGVAAGPSEAIQFPQDGPYDRRLGYVGLPRFIESLSRQGYAVESQARISEKFDWYFRHSGIAPYREKTQTGLTLIDRDGEQNLAAPPEHPTYDLIETVRQKL